MYTNDVSYRVWVNNHRVSLGLVGRLNLAQLAKFLIAKKIFEIWSFAYTKNQWEKKQLSKVNVITYK